MRLWVKGKRPYKNSMRTFNNITQDWILNYNTSEEIATIQKVERGSARKKGREMETVREDKS